MNIRLLALLVGLVPVACVGQVPSYWRHSTWQDPNRGFLWYGVPRGPVAEPQPAPAEKSLETMSNKELGAEIERLLAIAVEGQSPEAVREYLYVQQYAMDRASRFSDVFRRTVWATPELDYSLRGRPTNALALATFDAARAERQRASSHTLAQTHGLFFFFRSGCPYCHQLAPVLRMYERSYGVEVFAVSLDGSTLPEFPAAQRDNGTARQLNVTAVPALFLADQRTGQLQPVGYGMMSLEDLVTRIHVLTQTIPGEEY